eukprot:2071740-Rhodomonas_salina.1
MAALHNSSRSSPTCHLSPLRISSQVLVGDVMHTIKPFFSEGINMAFHDVAILDQCLARHKGDRHSNLTPSSSSSEHSY